MSDPWVLDTQIWLNTTYSWHPDWETVPQDGSTGWPTVEGLTRALQVELGISSLSSNFGPTTLAELTSQYGAIGLGQYPGSNVVKIIQGGSYCKGYDGGGGALDGYFDAQLESAVVDMRGDLGLSGTPKTLTPKMFKGLLTMDAWSLVSGGSSAVREAQKALNGRYIANSQFFLGPTDGLYGREVQERLMYSIQYEAGISGANGNFGPATQAAIHNNGIFGIGYSDTTEYWCHLFQAALRFNGYPSTPFTGSFDSSTQAQMHAFQDFIALPRTTGATFSTWASLLVSSGDPDRPATGADCSMTITPARLTTLQSLGYSYFGRYLTNTPGAYDLDKCIKKDELERIFTAGKRMWPIFQTGGAVAAHFTYQRGKEVSEEAANAAWAYRIPDNTIIYFAVDYDALDEEIDNLILPYFEAVNDYIGTWGQSSYRVGIYAPRHICERVADAGFSVSSFVSDMSTGYSGNKGFLLPGNWAFDQIHELDVGSGLGEIRIDRNVVSGRNTGVGALAPAIGVGPDPLMPALDFSPFEDAWFNWCLDHPQAVLPAQMAANRSATATIVKDFDALITDLSEQYGVYKAHVLTVLIWERLALNAGDLAVDAAVVAYYTALANGWTPPPGSPKDSSTGPCQIFASTAIASRNWARSQSLISDGPYDPDDWEDMWAVWYKLNNNLSFNLESALLTLMHNAYTWCDVTPGDIGSLTPSQVAMTFYAYNGDPGEAPEPEDSMKYGRQKAQLYYLIRKWYEDLR